ncbi:O-Antigen ligase [Paracoccus isoporae]|uniref:O-Antigen ligase n=1 Tax=Paracoccus isoporae TaxID=591205 RepID=A0A1G7BD94_9RHOB|nr:O-antigen ligase family protein [Paracoccus isoporae]SDE24205.1 O-Antigen ligase [Paracoccus isoporae]
MTASARRLAPAAVVILLVVSTVFNDLLPLIPAGELSKDAFIYVMPLGLIFLFSRPARLAMPTAFTLIFLALILAIVASVVVNYDEIAVAHFKGRSGMSRIITQAMAMVLGVVVAMMFYNFARNGQMRDISRGAQWGLLVMAGFGVLEVASWYGIPGLTQLFDALSVFVHAETSEFYPIRLRLTAFESSWAAVMLTFIFPFAVTHATRGQLVLYTLIVVIAMVLMQSRTAMLVMGIQFLVLIWAFLRHRRDHMIHLATLGCAALLALFLVPGGQRSVVEVVSNMIEYGSTEGLIDPSGGDENMSNVTRLAAIQAGVSMFREAPVFGVGFGQYGFNYPAHVRGEDLRSWEVRSYLTEADIELGWPPAYSLHVRLLSELGVVGYGLWLALILPSLFRSLRYASGVTYLGRMHLAVATTLIGWMLLGASIDSFRFFGGWIALGVGYALPRPPVGVTRR